MNHNVTIIDVRISIIQMFLGIYEKILMFDNSEKSHLFVSEQLKSIRKHVPYISYSKHYEYLRKGEFNISEIRSKIITLEKDYQNLQGIINEEIDEFQINEKTTLIKHF